jgi:hypothetical protein
MSPCISCPHNPLLDIAKQRHQQIPEFPTVFLLKHVIYPSPPQLNPLSGAPRITNLIQIIGRKLAMI